jgi:4-alpha-glucanotransferase
MEGMESSSLAKLHELARLYGIKTAYQDMLGRRTQASCESIMAVLKSLGAALETIADLPQALREKEAERARRPLEPVLVAWGNEPVSFDLRVHASFGQAAIPGTVVLETGEKQVFALSIDRYPSSRSAELEGEKYLTKRIRLEKPLPFGYHLLVIEMPGKIVESRIISSPVQGFSPQNEKEDRNWGVFLPLYALHSRRSWGAGDFADFGDFMRWVSRVKGAMIGTLPLLPSFFDESCGPSPYVPASRLFWNEFYLSIDQIPELRDTPDSQSEMNSTDFQAEVASLRGSPAVDYSRQLRLKRKIIQALSDRFFRDRSDRLDQLRRDLERDASIENYARFRAAGERHGLDWSEWPDQMKNGQLGPGDYSEEARQYHLYSQWVAGEQVNALAAQSSKDRISLYLDLPVGVHSLSYDVWREKESFVWGVCGGAPPDPVFTSGQNWNFPPMHPEKIREQGYRYYIACIKHQLKVARALRIDHIMGFHRLFWIPRGMDNSQGLYVQYHPDEFYAILTLESLRHNAIIVGEDLGMIPAEVRPAMARHAIYRTYVGQYELIADNSLGTIPSQAIAGLNTHDMYPFASFWQEKDIQERLKLGLLSLETAQRELESRRQIKRALISILQYRGLGTEINLDIQATLRGVLGLLGTSPAHSLLVNLEDLWLESRPQNIPGTNRSQNWSRKARYSLEEFTQLPQVLEILSDIDRKRKGVNKPL